MAMIDTRARGLGQRSLGLKVGVESDGRTDGRTKATALRDSQMRSVNTNGDKSKAVEMSTTTFPISLHHLLPPCRTSVNLRARGHRFELPVFDTLLHKKIVHN